jgi:large subunit ribosomal protein L18
VFRSNKFIYAQVIDDAAGRTLAAASSRETDINGSARVERSKAVGQRLAERAKAAGVESVVFDRGGYRYHGNVRALAEGARDGGLQF